MSDTAIAVIIDAMGRAGVHSVAIDIGKARHTCVPRHIENKIAARLYRAIGAFRRRDTSPVAIKALSLRTAPGVVERARTAYSPKALLGAFADRDTASATKGGGKDESTLAGALGGGRDLTSGDTSAPLEAFLVFTPARDVINACAVAVHPIALI